MASNAITQAKGQVSFVFGTVPVFNLSKDASISYDIGQSGDTYSSLNDVVHVLESVGSVISTITVTIPKGAPEIALLDLELQSRVPAPLLVRDDGIGYTVAMASASCSQVALSDTTGGSEMETVSYSFKGNLFRATI
jgi:hypothetical protein